jgi:hypothetical protein
MVNPEDVQQILSDAARLVAAGEIVVFGSAALAFWLSDPPMSRDVDVWVLPSDRGELVEALMGELSWYHDKHAAYVEVWAPETFAAPTDWRDRARSMSHDDFPDVSLVIPHPHDVLFAKLERMESKDLDHAERILVEFPLSGSAAQTLAGTSPHRNGGVVEPERIERFEHGLTRLLAMLSG